MFGSVATSNVTVSCIVPSLPFVDCMYSMLSTPFICCSSGVGACVGRRDRDLRRDDVRKLRDRQGAHRHKPGKDGDDGDHDRDDRTVDEKKRNRSGASLVPSSSSEVTPPGE